MFLSKVIIARVWDLEICIEEFYKKIKKREKRLNRKGYEKEH